MTRRTLQSAVFAWVIIGVRVAAAGIFGSDRIEMKFERKSGEEASTKISRLSPDATRTTKGLVLEGEGKGWVESRAFPVGLAYRAAFAMTVHYDVTLVTPARKTDLKAYIRYGCDRVHWSDWELPGGSRSTSVNPPPLFLSDLSVPREECERFRQLADQVEQPKEGTVWGTGAYFRWLAQRDSGIFSKAIPLIGYVQIKIVNGGRKPVTVRSIKGAASWYVSGLHQVDEPFDSKTQWHFDLRPDTDRPTSQPTTKPTETKIEGKKPPENKPTPGLPLTETLPIGKRGPRPRSPVGIRASGSSMPTSRGPWPASATVRPAWPGVPTLRRR